MTLSSKFPGTCKACGCSYAVGDSIEWVKGVKGARHTTINQCLAAKSRKATLIDRPKLDLTPIVEFLQGARDRGLKFPKLRVLDMNGTELRLGITASGKAPGSIGVNSVRGFLGCIRPSGEMTGPLALDSQLQTHLVRVAKDPAAAAKEYAALMCRCSFCGLPLTDAGSVEVGYGPICAAHWNLPHSPKGTPVLHLVV